MQFYARHLHVSNHEKKKVKRPFWEQRMYSCVKKEYEQRAAQTFRSAGAFYIKACTLSFLIVL